jgi:peptide/nickel transport system substrate-binding protein
VTPGHGEWYVADLPKTEFDQARARTLLGAIGLRDRNGDGLLDDESGKTARFTVLTSTGNTVREKTVRVVQEQLRKVGLTMDIATMDPRAVPGRWGKGEYDAIYFSILFDSFDPARYGDYWLSSGPFHFWNPGQTKPATPWEAQIDALMRKQTTMLDTGERRRIFADVQRVFAEHLPALYFAAAKVTVPTSARVRGVTPSVLPPPVLWNAEMLWLSPAASGARR